MKGNKRPQKLGRMYFYKPGVVCPRHYEAG